MKLSFEKLLRAKKGSKKFPDLELSSKKSGDNNELIPSKSTIDSQNLTKDEWVNKDGDRVLRGANKELITISNPRIDLNEFERNHVISQNIFKRKNFYFKLKANSYISLEVTIQCSTIKKSIPKGAIVQVGFFDSSFKNTYLKKVEGFSKSATVGLYSYLSLFPDFQTYSVKFKSPADVSAMKVSVQNWALKAKTNIVLHNIIIKEIDEETYNLKLPTNEFLHNFDHIPFDGKKVETITAVQNEIQSLRKKRDETPPVLHKIYEAAFYSLKIRSIEEAYEYGFEALNFLYDPTLENDVVRFLRAQGHVNLPLTIRRSSIQNKRAKNDMYYKRLREESKYLREEFSFSEKKPLTYNPFRNSFYLLHNSLPYNSGGYATRTHGLLSSINEIGDFKTMGLSRPGYPSDHGKHISKALPSYIPPSNVVDNVKYFRLKTETRSSKMLMKQYHDIYVSEIVEKAKFYNPFVIHAASNSRNGLAGVEAARKLGIKSIYEVRGLWELTRLSRQPDWEYSDQYHLLEKHETEACKGADVVFTLTRALKKILIARGVNESKIHIIPNAVNVKKFVPTTKDTKLAKELGIKKDEVVVGYIGSVVNYEGLDDLVEALSLLEDNIKFKFLLVGDGAYYQKVLSAIDKHGMKEKVILTGRVPHEEVTRYYSLVDIAPFPRRPYKVCEAVSPLKPFEALAMEKTVLVSSCDALVEIIEHNDRGLVFEKGNIQDMAEKLKMLILDKKLRDRLAKTGLSWVKENRDWNVIAAKANKIYNDLFNDLVEERSLFSEENEVDSEVDNSAHISNENISEQFALTGKALMNIWGKEEKPKDKK